MKRLTWCFTRLPLSFPLLPVSAVIRKKDRSSLFSFSLSLCFSDSRTQRLHSFSCFQTTFCSVSPHRFASSLSPFSHREKVKEGRDVRDCFLISACRRLLPPLLLRCPILHSFLITRQEWESLRAILNPVSLLSHVVFTTECSMCIRVALYVWGERRENQQMEKSMGQAVEWK